MFYISVLINLAILGTVPPLGWIQDTVEYPTHEVCLVAADERGPEIEVAMMVWFHNQGEIVETGCMTRPEFVEENIALGHDASLFEDY